MTPREGYSELLALTKQYLLQEFGLNQRILAESDTYNYFKTYAQNTQKRASQNTENKVTQKKLDINNAPSSVQTYVPIEAIKSQDSKTTPTILQNNSPTTSIQPPSIPLSKEQKVASKKVEAPSKTTHFEMELPSPLKPVDFGELRKIIHEKIPQLALHDQLPDDTEAKALASMWMQEKQMPELLILSFDETPKPQAFLSNIAKALKVYGINTHIANAAKLERNNEWQKLFEEKSLKLIMASSSGLYNLPGLQKYYREGTKQGGHFLGDRPLLLLSDLSIYLQEPSLKSSLWGAIRELV